MQLQFYKEIIYKRENNTLVLKSHYLIPIILIRKESLKNVCDSIERQRIRRDLTPVNRF